MTQGGSWSPLFSSSSNGNLVFHSPKISEGRKTVSILKAIHDLGSKIWKNVLVAQFFDPPPPPFFRVQVRMWEIFV